MAWPKGKSRKGHVNADGTPHKAKGDRLRVAMGVEVRRVPVGIDPFKKVPGARPVPAPVPEVPQATEEEVEKAWPLEGTRAVTEKCPKCGYPYADGGYCDKCHWMAAITLDPYDSNRGRKFR